MMRIPLKNIILFESAPSYADNTRAVFNEFLKRGINKKYKLIWVTNDDIAFPKDIAAKNVFSVKRSEKIYKYYYIYTAKHIICCNDFLPKARKNQQYYYLSHGCAIKDVRGKYSAPDDIDKADFFTLSKYFIKIEARSLNVNSEFYSALGFPRNDMLFIKTDIFSLFPDRKFTKAVYWMPTFRQHKFGASYSSISIPVIYSEETAKAVNSCAAENGVLLIVKPHPAQDVSKIKKYDLSNIVFINDEFTAKNNINNYSLLGSCDALLTDYSSVYYDFLLCDKPIGLCWEDFEEFKRREGFAVDVDTLLAGGEKIYNHSDLCSFIRAVANGEDHLADERERLCSLIHDYRDGNSSKRVADYIDQKL